MDPKSWLDKAITGDKGGQNAVEGKDQVNQLVGSIEMMWSIHMDGTIAQLCHPRNASENERP